MGEIDVEYEAAAEQLADMLFDSEEVVATCHGQDGNKKMRSYYLLTDKRLLRFEDNMIGHETDTYRLDNIDAVDFDTGVLKNKVTLHGSGIDDEFTLAADADMEGFVSALREQTL